MSKHTVRLLLSVLLLASSLPAATTGVTSGATVVILVGLPGDVESERSYSRQLDRSTRRAIPARTRCSCATSPAPRSARSPR